jgi:general L-amino acid transport system permease protein
MSDTHAQTVTYVRDTMLPQAAPPSTAQGPVKWLRESLFSSIPYTILTIAALYVIYVLLSGFLPWLLGGVWTTANIRECREVLDGGAGGCFSVLSERWNQLLFGISYPQDGYWRPTLAFVLLFVAVAPVLFSSLPRQLLIVTALYPFIAFWLIWGGSLLVPLSALASIGIGYFVYSRLVKTSFAAGLAGGVVAAAVIWLILSFITPSLSGVLALEEVVSRNMGGFMLNMILGVICVSLSLPLGIVLALGRQSSLPIIKMICVVFINSSAACR